MTKLNPVKIIPNLEVENPGKVDPNLEVEENGTSLRLNALIVRYPTAAQHRDHYQFLRSVATFHNTLASLKKTSSESARERLKNKAEFFVNHILSFIREYSEPTPLSTQIQDAVVMTCTFNGHSMGPWRGNSDNKLTSICEICTRSVYISPAHGAHGEPLVIQCRM